MKNLLIALFLITQITFATEKLTDYNAVKFYDGVAYKKGSSEPYTGILEYYVSHPRSTITTEFVNGLKEGRETQVLVDGTLREESFYTNGKFLESKTYYSPEKIMEHEVVNGDRLNETFYDKDGKVSYVKTYLIINNKRAMDGLQVFYNKKGDISTTWEMKYDNEYYRLTEYGENGNIKRKIYTSKSGSTLNGECFFYNNNGTIRQYTNYDKGIKNGIEKIYDENGNILYTTLFKNGAIDFVYEKDTDKPYTGKRVSYSIYDYSKEASSGKIENGIPVGTYKEPNLKVEYVNGKKNGNQITVPDKGQTIKTPYTNGYKEGLEVRYFNRFHKKIYTAEYKNDKKNGTETFYYTQTQNYFSKLIKATYTYVDGTKEGEYVSYHETKVGFPFFKKQPKYEVGMYKNNKKEGVFNTYDEKGRLALSIPYENDRKNGTEIAYDKNGKVVSTKEYKKGILNGKSTSFDKNGKVTKEEIYINGNLNGIPEDLEF